MQIFTASGLLISVPTMMEEVQSVPAEIGHGFFWQKEVIHYEGCVSYLLAFEIIDAEETHFSWNSESMNSKDHHFCNSEIIMPNPCSDFSCPDLTKSIKEWWVYYSFL